MASTVRWLSTASLTDLTTRLQTNVPNMGNLKQKKEESIPESSTSSSNNSIKPMKEEVIHEKARVHPPAAAQTSDIAVKKIVLPPVPSFSDFVRSTKVKGGQAVHHSNSKRNSGDVSGTADKRMRSQ